MTAFGKGVREGAKETPRSAMMNVHVGAAYIAERFRDSVFACLEDKPIVLSSPALAPCDGKSELEGHVEARGRRWSPIELNPREIMEGEATASYEPEDSIQAPFATGNFQRRVGDQPKAAQSRYPGEIEVFVWCVIGDIEKSRVAGKAIAATTGGVLAAC